MSKDPKPYVQPGEPLHEFLRSFWQRQTDQAEQETIDYRHPPLPLERDELLVKVDKTDNNDEFTLSAESTLLGSPPRRCLTGRR